MVLRLLELRADVNHQFEGPLLLFGEDLGAKFRASLFSYLGVFFKGLGCLFFKGSGLFSLWCLLGVSRFCSSGFLLGFRLRIPAAMSMVFLRI